jgi:hypothetical protein
VCPLRDVTHGFDEVTPSISNWLIYSLAPLFGDAAYADEMRRRFSLLTPGQAAALLAILNRSWTLVVTRLVDAA